MMVKQREVSDLAPFCFVMKIYSCRKTRRAILRVNYSCRKTRRAIFGVSFCFKMPEQAEQIMLGLFYTSNFGRVECN
jgi:hypothetical protein